MEKWVEIFKNIIPKEKYEILVENGEARGLIVKLISSKYNVIITFGAISVFRMLDEGIALKELFDEKQIKYFRDEGFSNTIYQLTNGEFDGFTRRISGGLYEFLS